MGKTYLKLQQPSGDVVKLQRVEYKQRDFIDLRVHFHASDENPEQPTKKGVCLSVNEIPRLRAAIEQAETDAIADGLLDAAAYQLAGLPVPAGLS